MFILKEGVEDNEYGKGSFFVYEGFQAYRAVSLNSARGKTNLDGRFEAIIPNDN